MDKNSLLVVALCLLMLAGCTPKQTCSLPMKQNLDNYARVSLQADLSHLPATEMQMLPLLLEVAEIMDGLFWKQAFGDPDTFLAAISDTCARQLCAINYGPWDRLNGNAPILQGYGDKPAGAQFYPADMTPDEYNQLADSAKSSQYTILRRNTKGALEVIPYSQAYSAELKKASELLAQAAQLASDPGLKAYLSLRSEALLTNDYFASDIAWMDMKTNLIDFVVGPIENYEDALLGTKTAFEAYLLLKDTSWSARLAKYTSYLDTLQAKLPVDQAYKSEKPGSGSDLGAYDVLYYAGDCNAGSKTIAINLPNDERVQLAKGSRRLQLKNAMKAKFDKILVPIADEILAPELLPLITFDAFFENVMFHEVAHGLGIKNTITGKGMVREALKEQYSAIEEGKADILGLYMVSQLISMGVLEADVRTHYATFVAGIFRSIRFGSASAHGKANLARYNYFIEKGAIAVASSGKVGIDFEKMEAAIRDLSAEIIVLQGDGDYNGLLEFSKKYNQVPPGLQALLDTIAGASIPVDIVFDQGAHVLGLGKAK